MKKDIVMTVTGPDRVGLVDHITKLLLEYEANIEASRMARLGGEFAMLMLVSLPEQKFAALGEGVDGLCQEGFEVVIRPTKRGVSAKYAGWKAYQIKVSGADHEGIIHQITHYLAQQGINIEAMDTEVLNAPMSGTPLFTMTAVVFAPPNLSADWREALAEVGDDLNVDTEVSLYTGEQKPR
jgi:glycine cleavage system transcriptional repressor